MVTNFWQNWQNDFYSASWRSKTVRNMAVPIQNTQWQYCSYIVCKFGQDRSSNPRDCEGNNCTFLDETAKIGIFTKYLDNYRTDIHQIFRVSSHMYGDYKTDISFAVAEETLLW